MNLAVQKNNLGLQILYRSPNPFKKRHQTFFIHDIDLRMTPFFTSVQTAVQNLAQ
mgnify:CR=1 FL=1